MRTVLYRAFAFTRRTRPSKQSDFYETVEMLRAKKDRPKAATIKMSLLRKPKSKESLQAVVSAHRCDAYEILPCKDPRGVDLISDSLPFGRLWYAGPNAIEHAIGYVQFYSQSHDAVIRVYGDASNVMETPKQAGESSMCTRLGSTLTISGERDAPRCL